MEKIEGKWCVVPGNALEDARFDHVSETGELVFVSGAGKFAVKVDEALERAILEAKQIRSEAQQERQSQAPSTLPISQIQSLIRAGADPARVAERYSLSEALVRRFSTAVETEKQYAIEQFLAVPAPKESRVRTLSELIERTFAAAHVRLEDVQWKATRRGLEPWKITAQFDSAGHAVHAEWSWNMHDNAVTCLNATARKLIGEQETPKEGHADKHVDQNFLDSLNLPGDSARSARIEQTVSAWNTPEPAAFPTTVMPGNTAPVAVGTNVKSATDAVPLPNPPEPTAAPQNTATQPDQTESHPMEQPDEKPQMGSAQSPDPHSQSTTKSKRRAGRSAVPSWDEILFGD